MVDVDASMREPENQWYFLEFYHVYTSYKPNLCTHEIKITKKRTNNEPKKVGLHPL
jgi:hypothetical protein